MDTNFTGNGLLLTALFYVNFLKTDEIFFFWVYKWLFYMAGGSSFFRLLLGRKNTTTTTTTDGDLLCIIPHSF